SSGSAPRSPRQEAKRPRRAERDRNQNGSRSKIRSKIQTEVMVLINADTLAGLDENPAELNGYGPISPETARTMILEALHWTPLIQDPATGEILNVGRTRRIPTGLKRWLQARDGTCRFPGCSVSVTHAEIDHTTPFAHGGPTNHANLEHLCPKHHRFKTLGHWTARQPQPGTIKWTSHTGRTYTTDPSLDYTSQENAGFWKTARPGPSNDKANSSRRDGCGDVPAEASSGESVAAWQAQAACGAADDPPPF
ncbi:MAG: HNH endonuclease signature motif containing protein, partial [Arthrobacter sp.]